MKIKVLLSNEKREFYIEKLKAAGFTITEDADVMLTEVEDAIDTIIVKDEQDNYIKLLTQDILYFESYGHQVTCSTRQQVYKVREKLYQLESMLE